MNRTYSLVGAVLSAALLLSGSAEAATCESLSSTKLTNGTVTSAQSVAAGALAQSGGRGGAALADLPALCRVAATLTPTKESDIKIEVHQGGAGPWMQNPEKLTDWAYRSVHETAVAAKALINAFYGEAPKFSYFTGCSAGGRQAMVAAQRYPADFDGMSATQRRKFRQRSSLRSTPPS